MSPSPQLCRCLPKRHRAPTHGRRQTLLVEWALTPRGHGSPCDWYAKATASTIQWASLCLETAFPFCCPPWQTKSCSELLTLRVRVTYMRNALTGHSNAKAGSASSEGSACRFTTWSQKGVVGTLGTYPGRGSQDNVRVDRPEHKALFAYRKRLEVPDPFDGSERGQERCLKRQELQLDWVQRLKGAPLKSRTGR